PRAMSAKLSILTLSLRVHRPHRCAPGWIGLPMRPRAGGRSIVIFIETSLKGAFIIDLERREDSRGFFARAFCQNEFREHGLKPVIPQATLASNLKKGTPRGMHFQFPPAAETKLVRCTRGAIVDIIVDLRPESETYLQHVSVELNEDNQRALYV